jgi:hypothetical protein
MKRTQLSYFVPSHRGARGVSRKPLHVLIDDELREKLLKLTKKLKASASDVIRKLIAEA